MPAVDYAYPRFRRPLLFEDMGFHGGPHLGQPFPEFDLPTAEGSRIAKTDFVGRRPMLMVFGSHT